MRLSLAFSTCPNDTFIFDAIVNKRIDLDGFTFDIHMADVEELNRQAIHQTVDVSKLSYHAYAYVANNYLILNAGSALGRGNGPLFVSKQKIYPDEVSDIKIAIPGTYTTAAFLLKKAYPSIKTPKIYLFSDIEEAILSNEVDAGVLIHEGRFTYADKGLNLITDLGQYWEQTTSQPIPLGCIAISRMLPEPIQLSVDRVLRRSVEFALQNPTAAIPFMRQHAKEMNTDVMQKHIALFVNEYTVNLGKNGQNCVDSFLQQAEKLGVIADIPAQIFVNQA